MHAIKTSSKISSKLSFAAPPSGYVHSLTKNVGTPIYLFTSIS
jgi:hypothetical protein